MWRIGINDLEDYIAEAYRRTRERIASGEIMDNAEPDARLRAVMSSPSRVPR